LSINLIALTGPLGEIGSTVHGQPRFGGFQEAANWFLNTVESGVVVVGRRTVDIMAESGVDLSSLPYSMAVFTRENGTNTVQEYLQVLREEVGDLPLFIAGGKQTYEAFLPFCSNFFIRKTSITGTNDIFLPPLFSPRGTVH
jgi:dihydrofolate reductase